MLDHISNGTNKLHIDISLLLSAMLHHGCVPENLLLCTVIPISKSTRKSMYNSNNYNEIALSSVLGKVLDKIIINKFSSVLVTSELQYGFKPDHSTTKCIFVVKETI